MLNENQILVLRNTESSLETLKAGLQEKSVDWSDFDVFHSSG